MKFILESLTLLLLFTVYHQVDGAVSQCYKCTVSCQFPTIDECPTFVGEFRCYSAAILQPPDGRLEYSKGCVLADDTNMITECNIINNTEGDSCYFCDTNLCNDHD
ncbi:hypothetical protein Zmor_023367 [Zophobas morio]|uniref:Uncharacterized protein n=1 Tax=Zophobas morio TaxID=2755281 RepID=A0AA38HWX9_9CUCU|nr:hypothetical protein Zmor_023367 [Zophobas morio]